MTKTKKGEINFKGLLPLLKKGFKKVLGYASILFFLLVAGTYGFVVLRINTLSNAQPTDSQVSAQSAKTTIPHIDPQVVQQLESLRDNSVNVQTLFQQARNNPFQE